MDRLRRCCRCRRQSVSCVLVAWLCIIIPCPDKSEPVLRRRGARSERACFCVGAVCVVPGPPPLVVCACRTTTACTPRRRCPPMRCGKTLSNTTRTLPRVASRYELPVFLDLSLNSRGRRVIRLVVVCCPLRLLLTYRMENQKDEKTLYEQSQGLMELAKISGLVSVVLRIARDGHVWSPAPPCCCAARVAHAVPIEIEKRQPWSVQEGTREGDGTGAV